MSRSRLQSLISNIDHMTCLLSSKNSPRNTVDFEAACSVYIRFRGVNGYPKSELVVSPRRGQSRGPRQATHSWSTQPAWSRRGRGVWRMITRVPPGTWETLPLPSSKAAGDTAYQLPIDPRLRVRGRGGRTTDATMVSPSEGNEARRNGRQGVAAPHSTVEAGEPTRGTPSREGGAVS